ncbi:hypothetical protein PR048_012727 [Dryococelus australis]|uniref:Uncharacterized protein n=1 Tax=Dryococelus australis TaxID=614101 RepID=A0ABQ9HQ71_9NEOP|nr:hypothetical protein PR048_012727 [Dryococelus australis]
MNPASACSTTMVASISGGTAVHAWHSPALYTVMLTQNLQRRLALQRTPAFTTDDFWACIEAAWAEIPQRRSIIASSKCRIRFANGKHAEGRGRYRCGCGYFEPDQMLQHRLPLACSRASGVDCVFLNVRASGLRHRQAITCQLSSLISIQQEMEKCVPQFSETKSDIPNVILGPINKKGQPARSAIGTRYIKFLKSDSVGHRKGAGKPSMNPEDIKRMYDAYVPSQLELWPCQMKLPGSTMHKVLTKNLRQILLVQSLPQEDESRRPFAVNMLVCIKKCEGFLRQDLFTDDVFAYSGYKAGNSPDMSQNSGSLHARPVKLLLSDTEHVLEHESLWSAYFLLYGRLLTSPNKFLRGCGGVVFRLFISHLGVLASIPGGVTPRFSHVGIVPDDATCRRVFSGISRFSHHRISAHFSSSSQLHVQQTTDSLTRTHPTYTHSITVVKYQAKCVRVGRNISTRSEFDSAVDPVGGNTLVVFTHIEHHERGQNIKSIGSQYRHSAPPHKRPQFAVIYELQTAVQEMKRRYSTAAFTNQAQHTRRSLGNAILELGVLQLRTCSSSAAATRFAVPRGRYHKWQRWRHARTQLAF